MIKIIRESLSKQIKLVIMSYHATRGIGPDSLRQFAEHQRRNLNQGVDATINQGRVGLPLPREIPYTVTAVPPVSITPEVADESDNKEGCLLLPLESQELHNFTTDKVPITKEFELADTRNYKPGVLEPPREIMKEFIPGEVVIGEKDYTFKEPTIENKSVIKFFKLNPDLHYHGYLRDMYQQPVQPFNLMLYQRIRKFVNLYQEYYQLQVQCTNIIGDSKN